MSITQTPQFLLYRTTFNDVGKSALKKGIVLGLSYDGPHITSLNITGSTDTEPSTMTMSFAIPVVTSASSTQEPYTTADSLIFDFKSNQTVWQVMDRVDLYVSPFPTSTQQTTADGKTETVWADKYRRLFMGIITNISTNWDGAFLTMTLTARDMFYWLSLAKIQQKPSIHEFILRGGLSKASDPAYSEEVKVLLAYKSKYQGKYIKDLITSILCDPTTNEIQGIFLPEMHIGTMLNHLGSSAFSKGINSILTSVEEEVRAKTNAAEQAQATAVDEASRTIHSAEELKQVAERNRQQTLDFSEAISKLILELKAPGSIGDAALDMLTQKAVRNVMASYWDNRFGKIIRENYFSFLTSSDQLIVPFPISYEGGVLLNGEYRSKLDFLQQLSQTTIFEIYQAPQGQIFVKPPLYNCIPIFTITAEEIGSVSRTIDSTKILTQVTTAGTMVVGSSDDRDSGVLLDMLSSFPLIQGTYTYLFPKGFQENILGSYKSDKSATPAIDVNREYNLWSDFQEEWKILKKKDPKAKFTVTDWDSPYGTPPPETENDITDKNTAQLYETMVANLIVTNAYKFNIGASYDVFQKKSNTTWGASSQEEFQITFTEDLTKLFLWIIKTRSGLSLVGDEAYIKAAVGYYVKKYFTLPPKWEDDKSITFIPASIADTLRELHYVANPGIRLGSSSNITYTQPYAESSPHPNERGVRTQQNPTALARAGSATIPPFMFRVTVRMDAQIDISDVKNLSTGEYNVLQHGLRSARIDNSLVRDNRSAVMFAKFIMDKNNASVETTDIVLKTLRPDILPGFPVYNELDSCVYYVDSIDFRVNAGSNIETELHLIARRRPIYLKADQPPDKTQCQHILDALQAHEPTPKNVYIGQEVMSSASSVYQNSDPALKTYLVGWEYIGGSSPVTTAIKDNLPTSGAFSPVTVLGRFGGDKMPAYGAIIGRAADSNTGEQSKDTFTTIITAQDKTFYHLGWNNPKVPNNYRYDTTYVGGMEGYTPTETTAPIVGAIAVTQTPPPTTLRVPFKLLIPLSYMMRSPKEQTLVELPTDKIKYNAAEGGVDVGGKIRSIIGAWSSVDPARGAQWNPKEIYTANGSKFSIFLAKAQFIMLKTADFTLGTQDMVATAGSTAINYYAQEYVVAKFTYYSPEEFRAWLSDLISAPASQNVMDGLKADDIPRYVEQYQRNLELFKKEKYNTVVVK